MGLMRGMARTAVVAGTATAVSGRVARRQARRWDQNQQSAQPQYAPPPQPQYAAPPPQQQYDAPVDQGGGGLAAELERLGDLRTQGLLSDDEFNAAKAKLLDM